MKITLAIPNYNGAETLTTIIPRVIEENFDEIYVIDDCSTDNSLAILEAYTAHIKIIKGTENIGAGANRNRILEFVDDGIIMFLDVDMELQTRGVTAKIKQIFENEAVAMVGGLILNKDGQPMSWNFGPEMHPLRDARAGIYHDLARQYSEQPEILEFIYEQALPYSQSWNIFGHEPEERIVDWVAEGNFCIRAKAFADLGGFDENMRHHEAHDLGKRLRATGRIIKFNPQIVARHLELDVRGEARQKEFISAQRHFYRKHWGMSRRVFDKLFDVPE